MANLAGFDVIAEAHIETIIDLLNLLPFTNPIDGKRIHLFGGPFSTDLNLPLGPFGNMVLRITMDASLKPVLHQSQATVSIKLSGGSSSIAGRALSNVSGQVAITIPLRFALPPTAAAGDRNIPNIVLSGTNPIVTLDAASQAQANAGFGAGGADRLTSGLRDALAALLNVAGTRPIPVMGFNVVPGIASDNPQVLSALPTVAWIDNTTLAVFGYYRVPATGGDVNRKTDSDIVQAAEEFFSDDRGLIPGRRVALLMSADGFRRVVGCPAIRKGIVTGFITKRDLQKWKDFVTARDGNDSQAEAEMNAWLNSTAPSGPETVGGIATIEANTPPPCGRGTTEITRLDPGITQSPVTPMLRRMEIALDEGRIVAKFNAGGNAEILTGDIAFNIDGVIDFFVEASGGVLVFRVDPHTPAVTLSSGGVTALVLALAKAFTEITGLWSVLINLAGAYMRFALSQALNKSLPKTFNLNLPQDTLRNRVLDLQIHPQSIVALGLVERKPSWNDFNPALFLDSSIDERASAAIPQPGQLNLPATDWGCPTASFPYNRSFWDESFTIRARARDIPLPITLTNWRMDVGNITESWLLGSRVIDPRITWSNEIKPITAGTHTLHGNIEHLTELFVPSLDGPVSAANITVKITGDAVNGWHIRLLGSDGNFFLRISVDARDGNGRTWAADTFIPHKGEQVDLPPEYETHRRECDAKFQDWFARRAGGLGHHGFEIANVERGSTLIDQEVREGFVTRDLISRGDIGVFNQTENGIRELGPQFLEKIGNLHLRNGI